jgi:serine protease Do
MKPTGLHKALGLIGALALAAPLAPLPGTATDARADHIPSFSEAVKQAKPAVVTVRVEASREMAGNMPGLPFDDPQLREFFERFFGGTPDIPGMPGGQRPPEEAPPQMGMGSGFIIDETGLVVTNNHVVEAADTITVVLDGGEEHIAEIVGTDEKTDLAVLRIEADEPLPTVPWGDSEEIEVGDWVVAIGNPFGFGGTVTAGIVSARGRNLQAGPYDDFIQFDAPINRGNSGGPLFDQHGNVVGVNTAIFSPSGGNVGVGFAIPANMAQDVTRALIEEGHVQRGWLGVSIQPVTDEIAESLGLDEASGALVASVMEDGPAQAAGLKAGDVIRSFAGTRIETLRDLTTTVADTEPGRAVEVEIWRGGEMETLSVETGEMPEQQTARAAAPEEAEPEADLTALGLKLKPVEGGLEVMQVVPESNAAAEGIRVGDRIIAINQQDVRSIEDVEAVLEEATENERKSVLILLSRDGSQRFVTVERDAA